MDLRLRPRTSPGGQTAVLALALAIIITATVALGVNSSAPAKAARSVDRVRATPKPSAPQAAAASSGSPSGVKLGRYAKSAECPQMDNPGGGLEWRPSANSGPWPTDGTVSMPTLGVTAPIVRVGVDPQSHMVVPGNARDVAWLDQSGIPGRTNNVVLAGHIAISGVSGSFVHIGDLKPRQDVLVKMNGTTWHYKVVWNCAFKRDSELATQIMGHTVVPSVTLISCGGGWDAAARTHTQRLVVRAELWPPPKVQTISNGNTSETPKPTPHSLLDGLKP
jgi:sortase (surface protein transpeptidase)